MKKNLDKTTNIETIEFDTLEEFKKTSKKQIYNKYKLLVKQSQIMIAGKPPKNVDIVDKPSSGPSKPPRWFVDFIDKYDHSIQQVITRLDRIEVRLDKVEDILHRNNLK